MAPSYYKYRLILTYRSGRQVKMGVDGERTALTIARFAKTANELSTYLTANNDLKFIELCEERTGNIVWHKTPEEIQDGAQEE